MKHLRIPPGQLTLIVAIALLTLTACQVVPGNAAGQFTFPLTLVHSNDTWGYTDPCG